MDSGSPYAGFRIASAMTWCFLLQAPLAWAQIETVTAENEQAPAPHADQPLETITVSGPTTDEMPETTRAASGNRFIEEIVVTAQKREENIQDVAISVQAFSADLLDAKGVADPLSLPQVTPGLTVGSQAGFSVTYLRGVGSEAFLTADPSVALYIDGVYFPFAHGMAQNFGALERIEVLKGPQGTLFGRNAVGGAINVISKRPDFNKPEMSLQTAYSSFDTLQTQVSTNLPLLDNLALGIAAFYNSGDLPMSGTIAGHDLPREISRGARLRLRWAPLDNLDVTLSGFHLDQTGLSTLFALNSDPSPIARLLGVQAQNGYHGDVDDDSYLRVDNNVVYGDAVWSTDWMDVKLIGSHQSIETNGSYDLDGSPVPIASLGAPKQIAKVKSAELQLISNDSTWGSEYFKWVLGGYYFKSRQGPEEVEMKLAGLDLSAGSVLGLTLPPLFRNSLDRLAASAPGLSNLLPIGTIALTGLLDTESTAVFGQGTLHFTDWLALTLGGRYQVEKRSIVESTSNLATLGGDPIGLFNFEPQSATTTSFKPKASLELRPIDGTMLYFSYQQAIKGSTFNVLNIYDRPDYVRPEELEAYEAGIKTDLFGGLVRLSSAVFQYDISDLQVQFVSLLAGGAVTFENAGSARVRGVDFDAAIALFPDWIDGMALTMSGAYLDARYTDYRNGSGFEGPLRLFSNDNDYTGNRVTRTPKYSAAAELSKTTQTDIGPLEVAADLYYNSGFYYLAQNTAFNEESDYMLVGARISLLYEPWNLRITAFGRNLTDENYNYSRYIDDFGSLDAKAPPRTFGLRLNWTY